MPRLPDPKSGRLVPLAVAIALLGVPAPASEFAVQSANPHSGTYGARVTVNKTCTDGDATLPDGPISSSPGVEPCGMLTANDVDVVSGTVGFRAGETIGLGEGFSVSPTAIFSAETGELIQGAAYVRDETPQATGSYRLGFFLDPDNLTLSQDTQEFEHLVAYDAQGAREFLIGVTYNTSATEKRLFATAYEDNGTPRTTRSLCELALGTGWHYVEAEWKASTGTDGDLELSLDGGPGQSVVVCVGLGGGLDNDTGEISAVEWGVKSVSGASLGSADLDDFSSWDD